MRQPRRWTCCATWNAAGFLHAAPSPAAGAIPEPRPPSIFWPRHRCSRPPRSPPVWVWRSKNAAALLEDFCTAGIAVEVTHRSARRLFGLVGLAPLRDEIAPPRRPMPGRSRGRPPSLRTEEGMTPAPLPEPPSMRIKPPPIDFAELEQCIAQAEQTIRHTRRTLDALAHGEPASAIAPDACRTGIRMTAGDS